MINRIKHCGGYMKKPLLIIALAMLVPVGVSAQSTTFGTDTRTLHFFPNTGFQYSGGYLDDFQEFDLIPNGQTRSYIFKTYLGEINHFYVQGNNGQPQSVYHSHPVFATHLASADLATGELKTYAEDPYISELDFGSQSPTVMYNQGRSNASLYDTLIFSFDRARYSESDYVTLRFRARVEGIYTQDMIPASGSMIFQLGINPGGEISHQSRYSLIKYFGQSNSQQSNLNYYGNDIYGFDYTVIAKTQTMSIFSLLSVNAYGSMVDYSHTAALGLDAPEGVSFSSASGVFLSQQQNISGAVPEPATWMMMVSGMGLVGGLLRRRRVRTTVSFT